MWNKETRSQQTSDNKSIIFKEDELFNDIDEKYDKQMWLNAELSWSILSETE